MSASQKIVKAKIDSNDIMKLAPSIEIVWAYRGKKAGHLFYGKKKDEKYFDLASLTKIIATTSILRDLSLNKKISLIAPVSSYLKWYLNKKVLVQDLLAHSSGLPAHLEFYNVQSKVSDLSIRNIITKEVIKKKSNLNSSKKSTYSDVGFLVLQFIIEEILGDSFLNIFNSYKNKYPNVFGDIHFNKTGCISSNHDEKFYFRTGKVLNYSKSVLRSANPGEVHDQNSYSLGGATGHAGLFGSGEDVLNWGLALRKSFKGESRLFGSKFGNSKFFKLNNKITASKWSCGFMKPDELSSSCGDHFSKESIGHLGFTGTSFWWDPVKDLQIVLLTNRVHTGYGNLEAIKRWRPLLHNIIFESL